MKLLPEEKLRAIFSELEGDGGLYVSIPETGETLAIGEHNRYNAASTIKIPILALLLKDGEEGRLNLDAPVPIHPENVVRGSGILKSLGTGVSMSLRDYAVLMIIISDNSATNMVIDAVGIDRANAFFLENGWNDTHLAAKIFFPLPTLPDGTRDLDKTSAADLGKMIEQLLAGSLVSESVSRQMLQIMAAQQGGKLTRDLPILRCPNPTMELPEIPEDKLLMPSKGGSITNKSRHDAAVMLLPNGRKAAIGVMTATTDNQKAGDILARVAVTVYEALR